MHIIENASFRVALSEDAMNLKVTDIATGLVLESTAPFRFIYGGCYSYDIPPHCQCSVEVENMDMTVHFENFAFWARFKDHYYYKPENGPKLCFTFRFRLDGGQLHFRLEKLEGMDQEICTVIFPSALFQWPTGQEVDLILPKGYGSLYHFPYEGACKFPWHSLLLPFYGVFTPGGGFGVYIHDNCDQTGFLNVNLRKKGLAFCEHHWEFERELKNYPRELSLKFFPKGESYVQLAKWYRSILMAEGRFVSLTEKIAANPEVGKLPGSVIWKNNVYSTKQVPPSVKKDYSLYIDSPEAAEVEGKVANWSAYEIFDRARQQGFDRVCIYNTGWNYYGFDSGYPTRLPTNPERGTLDDFKLAAEYGRSLSDGYIYSVHDNYRDCYPGSPEYSEEEMIHDRNQRALRGGIWRGGRCNLMCGINALRYAERDLPRIAEMTGRGSIYIDVLGLVCPYACYHPQHRLASLEDLQKRRQLLKLAKCCFGSVATEGAPADFCADLVDLGAFYFFTGKLHPGFIDPRPVPLWQLVYHDSVLGYTSEGLCGYSGADYLNMIALYALLPTQFDVQNQKISRELRHVFCEEMLFHEFLPLPENVDGEAARTLFASGMEVLANCSNATLEWDGMEIAPHSFRLNQKKGPDSVSGLSSNHFPCQNNHTVIRY